MTRADCHPLISAWAPIGAIVDVRGGVGDSWEVGKSFVKDQGWSVLPMHDSQTTQRAAMGFSNK